MTHQNQTTFDSMQQIRPFNIAHRE